MIAVGLIIGVAVIVFWLQISAFAHISRIRNALADDSKVLPLGANPNQGNGKQR
jgi:hypothetical protein